MSKKLIILIAVLALTTVSTVALVKYRIDIASARRAAFETNRARYMSDVLRITEGVSPVLWISPQYSYRDIDEYFDLSGNANHGTCDSAADDCPSFSPPGLDFDGVDDYVRVPDDASLQFGTGSFTATAWIYPINVENVRIVDNRGLGAGGSYKGWQLKINENGGNWYFYDASIDDASGNYKDCDGCGSTYVKNAWYHIAMVYEADNELRFYVNGNLDGTVNVGAYGDINNSLPTAIGAAVANNGEEGTYAQFFNGLIDEVRIYDRALSATQTQRLYLLGLPKHRE